MKTTLTPKTDRVTLYADGTSGKKVGTADLPVYDKLPNVIVFDDMIYLQNDRYSLKNCYHAVTSVHVATPAEFTPHVKLELPPAHPDETSSHTEIELAETSLI